MYALHQPGDCIKNQYQIVRTIGKGGGGTTYEAQDLNREQSVAIKSLSIQQIQNWKTLELLEREAQVLAKINHPAIPQYLDHFTIDTPEDYYFYLVQELAPGKSLATLVENGWKPTEQIVRNIAHQVLQVLDYLHSQVPPILHRDIKPENIIYTKTGKIYLVDFGAVQAAYRETIATNNTFVGTFGYMPLEQIHGKTQPASDLYALGASLVYLLTHCSPSDLPQKHLKIDFRQAKVTTISKKFADWLDKMLEPDVENRFQSAKEALRKLSKTSPQKTATFFRQKNNRLAILIFLLFVVSMPLVRRVSIWFQYNELSNANYHQILWGKKNYYHHGIYLHEQEKYRQAVEAFSQAIALGFREASIYRYRGLTYYSLQEYQKAMSDYHRAIELEPNNTAVYNNRGLVYDKLEKYQKAIADYHQAIEIDPNYYNAYLHLGNIYNQLKQYQKAISHYHKAIDLHPQYALAYNNMGNVYYDLEQYQKAIAQYTRALEIDRNWGNAGPETAYDSRGDAYYNLEKYQNALSNYDSAVRVNSRYADAYYMRGQLYKKRGNPYTARSNLERAAELYQKQGNREWYRKTMEEIEQLR